MEVLISQKKLNRINLKFKDIVKVIKTTSWLVYDDVIINLRWRTAVKMQCNNSARIIRSLPNLACACRIRRSSQITGNMWENTNPTWLPVPHRLPSWILPKMPSIGQTLSDFLNIWYTHAEWRPCVFWIFWLGRKALNLTLQNIVEYFVCTSLFFTPLRGCTADELLHYYGATNIHTCMCVSTIVEYLVYTERYPTKLL